MFKTIPGNAGQTQRGVGNSSMRVRDTEFPSVPSTVSDAAQTQPLPLDMNIIRQFNFTQQDRSALPERPSTSGGPANTADFVARKDAWKRETRDDLDFPLPSHSKQVLFYDFPLPGGLPTPDSSPKGLRPPRTDSLAPSSPRPVFVDEEEVTMATQRMDIGMAIGSPTQAPPSWQPQFYGQSYSPSPDPTEMSIDANIQPQPKQKSKWKVFGGLFSGKKHTAQAQNFYQLQTERSPEPVRANQPIRGWTTVEASTEKKKPDVQRANTAPNRYHSPREYDENPEIVIDGSRVEENVETQTPSLGGRLLDVDIPNVEMERYSIMFGSLLDKSSKSTPSLLIRRQATLEKLKMVNEELAIKEREIEEKERQVRQPRRATSPQPTRSPAFSLFPNTPSRDMRTGRTPSPNGRLVRSNTSPAALSPSRPSFAPGPDNEIHATLMEPGPHIPVVGGGWDANISQENLSSSGPKPLTIKKKTERRRSMAKVSSAEPSSINSEEPLPDRSFTPEISNLSQSPNSNIYDVSPLPSSTYKPSQEPRWDAIPRTTPALNSISGSTTSHSDHSASASGSSSFSTGSITTPAALGGDLQEPYQAITRNPSPKPVEVAKNLPIPMSKFTAPPQAHKTRGRSQTTSESSRSRSQIPRPSSRPRANGPTEISGPTNLRSTPLPVTVPDTTGFKFDNSEVRVAANRQRRVSNDEDDEESRMERLADVSIARQISVSRQQRQLLVPIKGSIRAKAKIETSTASVSNSPDTSSPVRPVMRMRASTISASPGVKIHDQNFPSPGQKILGNQNFMFGTGVNVANVTSPLAAVEKAVETLSPSPSMSNIQKLKKEVEQERKEMFQEGVRAATPTLVIVGGNGKTHDRGDEEWEGAMVNPKKSDGIAERRRKARAEKLNANGGREQRKGHEYKKSEKVVVERV